MVHLNAETQQKSRQQENTQADHNPFERKYQGQPSKNKAKHFNGPRSIIVQKPTRTPSKNTEKDHDPVERRNQETL